MTTISDCIAPTSLWYEWSLQPPDAQLLAGDSCIDHEPRRLYSEELDAISSGLPEHMLLEKLWQPSQFHAWHSNTTNHEFGAALDYSTDSESVSPRSQCTVLDSPFNGGEMQAYNDHGMFMETDTHEVQPEPNFVSCAECKARFDQYQRAEQHGRVTGHMPFACTEPKCHKRLARRDTMQRHMAKHRAPQFSCKWCDANGIRRNFTRRDHYKNHSQKCPHRPKDKQRSQDNVSDSVAMKTIDAELKMIKIKELMGHLLPPEQAQLLQRHLDTLDQVKTRVLCQRLVHTVLDEAPSAGS